LTLGVGGTETFLRQETEFFVAQMAQIGLEVRPQYETWARHLELIDDKQLQVFTLGWTPDYPDEQTFFQLFSSRYRGRGGLNSCNYVNPDYDALYDKSAVLEPGPERDALYRRMQQIVMEDCPWLMQY